MACAAVKWCTACTSGTVVGLIRSCVTLMKQAAPRLQCFLALLGARAVTLLAFAQRGLCSVVQCCVHLPVMCAAGRPSLLRGCLGWGLEGYVVGIKALTRTALVTVPLCLCKCECICRLLCLRLVWEGVADVSLTVFIH
jgi:hypothetical protein